MQVMILMAGEGKRFAEVGYKDPKPLIKVGNKCLIELVLDNICNELKSFDKLIILCKKEHIPRLEPILTRYKQHFKELVYSTQYDLSGPSFSILLASNYLNENEPIIICNSDQYIKGSYWLSEAINFFTREKAVGGIFCFAADDPKWSFVKLNHLGQIVQVKEKEVISGYATVGIYYWSKAKDMLWSIKEMIRKDIKTNGLFYLAPSYNELIRGGAGDLVLPWFVNEMYGLGTPKDLEFFKQKFNLE